MKTHIAPLAPERIADPELRALLARCAQLGVPDAAFAGILARAPQQARAVLRALLHSHTEGGVDHRLKEIIRIRLARIAGDRCGAQLRSTQATRLGLDERHIEAGAGAHEDDALLSPAERCALRYARLLYLDPSRVDAAFYTELKTHFSEAQVMELGAFIALHYGMLVFARTLRAATPP